MQPPTPVTGHTPASSMPRQRAVAAAGGGGGGGASGGDGGGGGGDVGGGGGGGVRGESMVMSPRDSKAAADSYVTAGEEAELTDGWSVCLPPSWSGSRLEEGFHVIGWRW